MPRADSPFALVTELVIPALSLIGVVFSLVHEQPALAWCLGGLTALSLFVGVYSRLKARAHAYLCSRHDDRVAKREWVGLGAFVRRFEEFLDPRRSDTLPAIANHAQYSGGPDVGLIIRSHGLVPVNVFYGWWDHLRQDCQQKSIGRAVFLSTINSFNLLVHEYNHHVVQAAFGRARDQLRPILTPDVHSALELCREKFVRFLDDYTSYVQHVNVSLRTGHIQVTAFQRVGPL